MSPTGQARLTCPTFSWSEVEGAEGYELVEHCLRQGGSYAWLLRAIGTDAGWSEAADAKLAKNEAKYPADTVWGSAKKYDEY